MAEIKTIQNGAHQFTSTQIQNYSLMLGGLNVTHDALQQYDPLLTGYGRLFMVRKPKTMTELIPTKFANFKHILEYGNTQVGGLNDVSVDPQTITGGYAGRSFDIPATAKDDTNEFNVTVYEFSGSPIREVLHTWINTTIDLQSGLTHYGGLIASGQLEYSQANHTAEFIYVVTDRTGMNVEYACMFANCFPKGYKNDQFNYQQGEHNFVETQINFSCTKYESIDINQKAKKLLQNYQILVNSLEFHSGLTDIGDNAEPAFTETKGYDSKDGKLKPTSNISYFVNPTENSTPNGPVNSEADLVTPSWSIPGNNKMSPTTQPT